jgi:hypothetical protein
LAALFQQGFLLKGVKLDAQVLATALSVYATNATLDFCPGSSTRRQRPIPCSPPGWCAGRSIC